MFDRAFDEVMGYEGGYSNHPDDRGGETYRGIARNRHPDWSGWQRVDKYRWHDEFPDILNEDEGLQELVREFYRKEFWNRISGDEVSEISHDVARELFDVAVNMGTYRAGTFLQRALNLLNKHERLYPDLRVDGDIGPRTLSALRTLVKDKGEYTLLKMLNVMQGCQYIYLAETDQSQETNIWGWFRRVSIRKSISKRQEV